MAAATAFSAAGGGLLVWFIRADAIDSAAQWFS
jgi:hypothetical protein